MDIIIGKILKVNNWPDGKIIGLAKDLGNHLVETGMGRDVALARLEAVRQNPGSFLADSLFAGLARECLRITQKDEPSQIELRESPLPFPIWGVEQIDQGAIQQMETPCGCLSPSPAH